MRSLVIPVLLMGVVAACGGPPGVVFNATLSNPNGDFPLPVTLGDTTGLVVAIGAAPLDAVDFRDAGVVVDPNVPQAFILTWLGGMCDSDAALAFSATDSGFDLHLWVHEKLGLGCPAAGIPRGLRIATSKPIPVATVSVSGSRTLQLVLDEDCGLLRAAATSDAKIACFALIAATVGERTEEFARVAVSPDDGACPGTECSTNEGIAAQRWRVDAMDRNGQPYSWRCKYGDEATSCTLVAESSPS